MKYAFLLSLVVTSALLDGCLWWGRAYDGVDSCDLDTEFSDSKQNVNCVETAIGSDQYVCTCPDGEEFPSSDTCDKSAEDQGALIDTACPEESVPSIDDSEAPSAG